MNGSIYKNSFLKGRETLSKTIDELDNENLSLKAQSKKM